MADSPDFHANVRPGYDSYRNMDEARGHLAAEFAEQILQTCARWIAEPVDALDVLDIGCGYGATALELARRCRSVTGIEPATDLYNVARARSTAANATFVNAGIEHLAERNAYDLIVLDNVYEHLPSQGRALEAIYTALRPGGVLFLLTPNKLWPVEAHYRLPFLSYLPVALANLYLRATRRGVDYTDASYAPTARSLARAMGQFPWEWEFTLPGRWDATMSGSPLHYRIGMQLLSAFPPLWAISKALLVVARKEPSQIDPPH